MENGFDAPAVLRLVDLLPADHAEHPAGTGEKRFHGREVQEAALEPDFRRFEFPADLRINVGQDFSPVCDDRLPFFAGGRVTVKENLRRGLRAVGHLVMKGHLEVRRGCGRGIDIAFDFLAV